MQNNISNLTAAINAGYRRKKIKIKVLHTTLNKTFLDLFIKEGILWSYTIYDKKKLIVYLKKKVTASNVLFKNFVFNKTSKYISKKQLSKLIIRYPISLFLLSTEKGFLTHNIALKLNLAGKLICKIR